MSNTDDLRTYDLRTLERKLRRGTMSRKDYEKYLKSLPDRADNAISLFGHGSADEDDDEGDEE